jgi:hypothetical protein
VYTFLLGVFNGDTVRIDFEINKVAFVWIVLLSSICLVFYLWGRSRRQFLFEYVGYKWRAFIEDGEVKVYKNPFCVEDGREMLFDTENNQHICPECGNALNSDYLLAYGGALSEARADADGLLSERLKKEFVSSVVSKS